MLPRDGRRSWAAHRRRSHRSVCRPVLAPHRRLLARPTTLPQGSSRRRRGPMAEMGIGFRRCDGIVRADATSFIEPDCRQVLVEEMARTDLPAFDIGAVGDDSVPPQGHDFVRLLVEHVLLKLPHQCALLCRIGLMQHALIEIDIVGIIEISVLLGECRARLVLADIEHWVDHTLAVAFNGDIKAAIAQTLEPRPGLTPILFHSSTSQMPRYLKGWSTLRFNNSKLRPSAPASFSKRFASARDFSMSGLYPAICSSSSLVAAKGEPGNTMPPTVCTIAIFDSAGAPCQRSIAKVSARRTRASSKGFRLWFGVTIRAHFQSLVCTVTLSPSAPTSSSTAEGGKLRNSIAARSLRIASTRTACLSA